MSDSDNRVRLEVLYGNACVRPEMCVLLVPDPPLTPLQWLWYGFVELWEMVIFPALLFSIAWTCLTMPLWWPR